METKKYVFFFGNNSVFSQFHKCTFVEDGFKYNCTEQYMHFKKSQLFGDRSTAEKIKLSECPKEQKFLGRKVRNFDENVWNRKKENIVLNGNLLKFKQNQKFLLQLIATGDKQFVECNPFDRVWGIGMSIHDPDVTDESKWRGQNLLGGILTRTRNILAKEICNQSKKVTEADVPVKPETDTQQFPSTSSSSSDQGNEGENSYGKRKLQTDCDTLDLNEMCRRKRLKLGNEEELLAFPEDVLIRETSIDQMVVTVTYDRVLASMMVSVSNSEKSESSITLSEEEVRGICQKMPIAISIADRYKSKTPTRPLDIPFQVTDSKNLHAVLFVKQNQFGRMQMMVDIRKCYKKPDGSFIYTKQGVRITPEKAATLAKELKLCEQAIERVMRESNHALKMVKCYLIMTALNDFRKEKAKDCEGCRVIHPSQANHTKGCLVEWADIVEEWWGTVYSLVNNDDVMEKADAVLEHGVLTSEKQNLSLPTQDEFKELIINSEDELKEDAIIKKCLELFHE